MGISVSAVYKLPNEKFSISTDFIDDPVNMVIGEFNTHGVFGRYSETNIDGELVESWSDASHP